MILPPINDLGTYTVVISPFTSLLSEAILDGKLDSSISDDLTVEQGCAAEGDEIANKVKSRLNSLSDSINSNFGIPLSVLLADFIDDPYDGAVNIPTAMNIATYFPHFKNIDELISSDLSIKYDKQIKTNIALHSEALDSIFSGEYFEELPLSFQTIYTTDPNPLAGISKKELVRAKDIFQTLECFTESIVLRMTQHFVIRMNHWKFPWKILQIQQLSIVEQALLSMTMLL